MMSDFENMNVMIENENINSIEQEFSTMIGNEGNDRDICSNLQSAECEPRENELGHYVHEKAVPRQDRFHETLESFTSEFNMRFSQEMDSMMSLKHSQINRAINTAIAERVIPEIQNIVSPISSSGNRDTEASSSPNSQEIADTNNGFRNKIMKKDSRSTGDLRRARDSSLYTCEFGHVMTYEVCAIKTC